MSVASRTTCPHCGAPLTPLGLPEAFFSHAHDLACFNDGCPYYVRGFAWMERQFGVKASYRYRIDAQTGHASPMVARGPRPPGCGTLPGGAATAAGPQERS
jgi:hypothetical protein